MTTELCLREIQLCHKVSAGPSFIVIVFCFFAGHSQALVGNQYGQRSIPHSIPENEFELLLSKLSEDQEGLTLFKRWFIKDNNSVPPQYVLQPITKHFPCYDDPESGPQHEAEVVAWNLMEARLLHLFHTAALEAERAGDISAEQKCKFFKSLTEREMEQGFLSSQQDNCSAVIFVRELPQLKKSEQQKHSSKFFDVTADGLLDTEAQELLNLLKHRIYNAHPSNLDLHSIELSKGAMDKSRKEHKDYLDNFCELIVSQVKGKIGRQAASPTGPAWPWLQQELSHQAKLSEEKCAVFTGQDSLLGKLCLMMWESTNILHAPLVVYGPPGVGKSALLCKLAQEMRSVLEPQAVVAPRLLGTSPLSSDVDSLLKGVCIQVCGAFGLTAPCPQTANSHAKLVRFFHAMLQRVSQQGETLLLILDALDNLSQANNGHKLHWLPKEIPPNVHLVVSTLHKGTALESLRAHVNDDKYFFEVDPLTFDQGRDIIDAYMNAAGRRLTSEQVDVILHSFHQSGSPLHLKLLLDMAKQWSSYTAASDVRLGSSIREVILQFLQALEIKHGRQFVRYALGYISLSRCGLSEAELRDVLSLDGDVLAEVYQKCLPPNPTIVRLPPLLWARLRHDLGEHLLERWEQGIIVLRFSLSQFTEVVKERYLSVERRVQMHTVLSEYFSGQWSQGRLKPILLPSLETQLNADRKVPSQPMWFAEGTANLRKLQELPYHLVHAGKWEELRHSLLGSLDWLYCKTLSCGVASVIQDLSLCASVMECPEIQLIRDCFLLLKPTLDFIDGLMGAVQSVKLTNRGDHCLSTGLDGCLRKWSLLSGKQLFCIQVTVLAEARPAEQIHVLESRAVVLSNTQGGIKAWHLDTGELLYEVSGEGDRLILGVVGEDVAVMSTDGRFWLHDCCTGLQKSHTLLSSAHGFTLTSVLTLARHEKLLLAIQQCSVILVTVTAAGQLADVELPAPASFMCTSDDESVLFAGCERTLAVLSVSPTSLHRTQDLQHDSTVLSAFSYSCGNKVITGSQDQIIRVWGLITGQMLDSISGMGSPVSFLSVYDGTIISASTSSPCLKLWQLDYDPKHKSQTCIPANCSRVVISKDGNTVHLVREEDRTKVLTWSSNEGLSRYFMEVSSEVCCLELAQHKQLLFCGLRTGTVLIYPLAFPEETLCLPPPESLPAVRGMAISPREDRIAVAHEDVVHLFEITARDSFPCVEGPFHSYSLTLLHSPVSAVVLLSDSRLLYGTLGGEVAIYDFKSASAAELDHHGAAITCIALSNWDTHALIGSQDCVQKLWSLNPLLLDHTMEYKDFYFEGVLCAAFSVNDKYVFTGSRDKTIKVWDVAT
ncbi:hypothetical protein P4O66_012851, partial [Electrophorus voltai]